MSKVLAVGTSLQQELEGDLGVAVAQTKLAALAAAASDTPADMAAVDCLVALPYYLLPPINGD